MTNPQMQTDGLPEDAGELAMLLKGTGDAVMESQMEPEEATKQLLRFLAQRDETVARDQPLGSQGRLSFGRDREGEPGLAVWLPIEEAEPGDEDED